MKSFESDAAKDSSAKLAYDASLKMWDNVYMKGGDYDDGGMTQTVEVNLMDKTTNSLKQLNQYIGTLGQLKIEQDKKNKLNNETTLEAMPGVEVPVVETAVNPPVSNSGAQKRKK
jgi:hypothetical protein